jgi:alkylation response protein AidB-like acyl-CoA dehydrogenase
MPTMDLTLSEEQRQIAQAVEDLLAQESGSAAVRRAAFDGDGFDRALWRQVAALGACGVHLPEAHGGLGLGVTELVLAAEAFGRRLACIPWFESVALAGTALGEAPAQPAAARWLPRIASGEAVATMDIGLVADAPVRARRAAGGWLLDGRLPAVPAALAADLLLLPAAGDDGALVVAIALDAPGVQRRARPNHDATRPLAEVRLAAVAAGESDCVARGDAAQALVERVGGVGAVALAAEQVGVAQQCLDLTVAYLQQRVQFGRPLATFQALKHRCSQMMVAVELARSAVLGAARGIDDRPDAPTLLRLAAMARNAADHAAQFCTQEAIQLHGGAGFTWDFDPQLYFKRAQAARAWLGTPAAWRERVAAALLDGEPA